ncbi:MAG: hypothetical protein ACLUG4_08760 [Bacilli bacterium]
MKNYVVQQTMYQESLIMNMMLLTRLIKETRTDDGSETLNIEYDYYKNSGNLRKVLNNGNVYKNLHIKMVEKLTFPYGVLIIQLVMIIMEIL